MKLRPLAYVALSVLLVVIGIGIWRAIPRKSLPISELPAGKTQPAAIAKTSPFGGDSPSTPAPPQPPVVSQPAASSGPHPEALADMDSIQLMFRDFRTRIGGNPVGTNAEIMKGVMGGNRFQARLGPPESQQLNEQGELLDRWATPYFFHQLSKDQMEVRSAGPDRTMWTTDDIVMK